MGHQIGTGDEIWGALERVVSDVQATRMQIARLQAEEARLLADAADIVLTREAGRRVTGLRTANDLALREVSSELGAAMRLSDRTVQARMSSASTLIEAFADTHRALADGRIDSAHAAAIVDCGASISDPLMRGQYERILLEAAEFETPPRLRAIARVVAARIDPELAAELQRRAAGTRRIRVVDLEDGMARLLADLPAVLAYAIFDRLTQMAEAERDARPDADERGGAAVNAAHIAADEAHERPAGTVGMPARAVDGVADAGCTTGAAGECAGGRGAGAGAHDALAGGHAVASDGDAAETRLETAPWAELRSLDELRADIFADLVLTAGPTAHGEGDALAAIRGQVQITIPVLTAAGNGDEPALLTGYGPIDNQIARELAAGAPGWDRVMFHPHSGLPLAVDRYRPSADLRRFLRARDERCRFPGCTRRPVRCEVDHTIDHAKGGRTCEDNLAHFCPRHHTVKHATAWRVRQLGGGVLEWTSLTGRRYRDRPPSVVQFVPSAAFARAVPGGAQEPPPF